MRILTAAVAWARLYEVADVDGAAQWFAPGAGVVGIAIAGEGAPLMAEWAVAEFASVLGLSTDAGKRLISEALELAYRLPRLWARVQAGEVTAWRARRVAAETGHLSAEAAGFVDRQVTPFAHSISGPGIERLVAEAIARFMPDLAEQTAAAAADGRCFEVDHQQVSFTGTSRVYGELDLADAIDLDAALTAGAEQLKALGSAESLDVRRSIAAGDLARHQFTLGFSTDQTDSQTGTGEIAGHAGGQPDGRADETDHVTDRPGRPVPPVREIVIYTHLSAEAITSTGTNGQERLGQGGAGFARAENTGTKLLTPTQIATWCGIDATQVTVRPVIDLNEALSATSYEVPDRIREQVILRDRTCRFPWCNRTARRADIDHITPWAEGGKTETSNLAALCRRHHRYKTHHHWDYHRTGPAAYEWTSPHGYRYAVGPKGTQPLTPRRIPGPRWPGPRVDPPDPTDLRNRTGTTSPAAAPSAAREHDHQHHRRRRTS